MNPDFEVLAPAGSFETLQAVLDAGADAVYLGGDRFGARAYADNFSKEELLFALDYAHLRGKKVYLTVNTLLKNEELSRLYAYLLPYYENGLDAAIVQDLGALVRIREWFPKLPVHASTQMTVMGADGVRFLRQYGVTRVVMARETSVADMKRIREETGMELEAFVHGALCYACSGQCLFSSMLGGRSGNRGRCAQPCRLPYTVLDESRRILRNEAYMLSMKDLCGIAQLPALKEAGVYSLKIEGRMKQAAYAAGVVSVYRRYADLLAQGDAYSVSGEDMRALSALGNRCGFTDAYFFGKSGRDMITGKKPSFARQESGSLPEKQYVPIEGTLRLAAGEPSELTISCPAAGKSVTVTGFTPAAAKNQPVTETELRQRLSRTKDSAFCFAKLTVEMEEQLFLPNGALNRLKRDAIRALTDAVLADFRRPADKEKAPDGGEKPEDTAQTGTAAEPDDADCVISIENRSLLSCALRQPWAKSIYIDAEAYRKEAFFAELQQDAGRCRRAGKRMFLLFPAVFGARAQEFYYRNLEKLRAAKPDGAVVRNYDGFYFVKTNLPELLLIADHSLYACNDAAAAALHRAGAAEDTVPLELNGSEIKARANANSRMLVYGYYPLMVSAQCVNQNSGDCDHCSKTLYLKDRYHKLFPVKNYCGGCYNIIYNSVPTLLFPYLDELRSYGVRSFRLHFSVENEEQTEEICRLFAEALAGRSGGGLREYAGNYTGGHYKRGVE